MERLLTKRVASVMSAAAIRVGTRNHTGPVMEGMPFEAAIKMSTSHTYRTTMMNGTNHFGVSILRLQPASGMLKRH